MAGHFSRCTSSMGDNGVPTLVGAQSVDSLMARMADLLLRIDATDDRRSASRPKAIQCRSFAIGQSWDTFSPHFIESVRVAHGFVLPDDADDLDAECLSWIPTKLEPGPTLSVFTNLDAAQKISWPILNETLKTLFRVEGRF